MAKNGNSIRSTSKRLLSGVSDPLVRENDRLRDDVLFWKRYAPDQVKRALAAETDVARLIEGTVR